MLGKILSGVQDLNVFRRRFKEQCDYFPLIEIASRGNELCAGTLVRISNKGKWFTVFVMETAYSNDINIGAKLLKRIFHQAYRIQKLYIFSGMTDISGESIEDIDNLQITEEERIALPWREQSRFFKERDVI